MKVAARIYRIKDLRGQINYRVWADITVLHTDLKPATRSHLIYSGSDENIAEKIYNNILQDSH